jgi:hypothetical protein
VTGDSVGLAVGEADGANVVGDLVGALVSKHDKSFLMYTVEPGTPDSIVE